jgi:hypothetical protein
MIKNINTNNVILNNDSEILSEIKNNEDIVVKKKRGRKPKIVEITEVVEKIPKKRGRKPTGKIIEYPKSIDMKDLPFTECLIAHIKLDEKEMNKIKSQNNLLFKNKNIEEINSDINKDLNLDMDNTNIKALKEEEEINEFNIKSNKNSKYTKENNIDTNIIFDDNIYTKECNKNNNINYNDNNIIDNKCDKCDDLENKLYDLENKLMTFNVINNVNDYYKKKIVETKVNFYDKNKNRWQDATDIACWWCCHQFDTIPLGLPNYYYKNQFYMYGCFCSLNCAYAYNLDLNDYRVWDRQSLIYSLRSKIDPENDTLIKSAPPKQTLELFGGHLKIEEYRENFFTIDKEYIYILPPLVSVVGVVEENKNMNKINNKNNSSDGYVLKRNKPRLVTVKNQLNTFII